jgi:hypothetical protein
MPSAQEMQCYAVLQAALESDIGIAVRTNNPTKARQAIYNFRKELGDTIYEDIQIRVSPDNTENELWLIRRRKASATSVTLTSMDMI